MKARFKWQKLIKKETTAMSNKELLDDLFDKASLFSCSDSHMEYECSALIEEIEKRLKSIGFLSKK